MIDIGSQISSAPGQKTIPIRSENCGMVSVATVHVGGVHKGGDGIVLLSFTVKILSYFQNFELNLNWQI